MCGNKLAIVRGGGDWATGVIYRLWKANFDVLALEVPSPLVVRGTVAVAEAVLNGHDQIEDMPVVRISSIAEWENRRVVAVRVDPAGDSIAELSPALVVDATMMKRYTGTSKGMAPLVLALGPGFSAPNQVDGVIETKRGHYLGRLITNGSAIPNTGVPGMEMGHTLERLLCAPADGHVESIHVIGDHVEAGEVVATVDGCEARADQRDAARADSPQRHRAARYENRRRGPKRCPRALFQHRRQSARDHGWRPRSGHTFSLRVMPGWNQETGMHRF